MEQEKMQTKKFTYSSEKGAVFFVSIVFLGCILQCLLPSLSAAETSVVTEKNITDAILGRKTFTDKELQEMDVNADGAVDVADLVKVVITSGSNKGVVADFKEGTSEVWEGDGTVEVVVKFSQNFTGRLTYLVGGTAAPGFDYNDKNYDAKTSSGSVNVDGLSATIPITIIDDDELDETLDEVDNKEHIRVETILLTIYYEEDDDLGYVPGSKTQHIVYIHDNDAIWTGTISNNSAQLHFKMRIIKDAKGVNSSLLTDGNGIIPSSHDTGVFDGVELSEWQATTSTASATSFSATVEDIDVPGTGTVFQKGLKRRFAFDADTAKSGHTVDWKSAIQGAVTEDLYSAENAYLDRQIKGTFVLLMQLPAIVGQTPELKEIKGQKPKTKQTTPRLQ